MVIYKGNYGIITGENEWYFYNESTKKYRLANINLEYCIPIDVELVHINLRRQKKKLQDEYRGYMERQVIATRSKITDYEPGTKLKYLGRNNTFYYVYIGYGHFHHEEYGIQYRDMHGYVYAKLEKEDSYFSFQSFKDLISNNADFNLNHYSDVDYAFYDRNNIKLTKNLITNKIQVIDRVNGVTPFKLKVFKKKANIWESFEIV